MTVDPPTALYRRDDLFAGWAPDDPRSYAATFDGRTYRTAVLEGLRAPEDDDVAHERSSHDTAVTRLLHHRLADHCEPVAIMGGHALHRSSATYEATARIAGGLAAAGKTVLTGGGPGAMEAGHLGARLAAEPDRLDDALARLRDDPDADEFPLGPGDLISREGDYDPAALAALHRWQSPAFAVAEETDDIATDTVGIPTWLYGHEPPTPLATRHAKYFENSIREDGLLALATDGIVFMPGKAGTIQEIFQDAAQNLYRTVRGIVSPMVFYDRDEYWTRQYPVRAVLEALFAGDGQPLVFTTDIEEIVELLGR